MFSSLKGLVKKPNAQPPAALLSATAAPTSAQHQPQQAAAPRPSPLLPQAAQATQQNVGATTTTAGTRCDSANQRDGGGGVSGEGRGVVKPRKLCAPLGSVLHERVCFIDRCLLTFALEAATFASPSLCVPSNQNSQQPFTNHLMLSVPSEMESESWERPFMHHELNLMKSNNDASIAKEEGGGGKAGPDTQPDAVNIGVGAGEPLTKRSRADEEGSLGTEASHTTKEKEENAALSFSSSHFLQPSTDVVSDLLGKLALLATPKGEEEKRENDSTKAHGSHLSATHNSDLNQSAAIAAAVGDMLKAMYSLGPTFDRAVSAEHEARAMNAAATQQGERDAATVQAVVVAMAQLRQRRAEQEQNRGGGGAQNEKGFEVSTEWSANVVANIMRLVAFCNRRSAAATATVNREGDGTASSSQFSPIVDDGTAFDSTINDGVHEVEEEEALAGQSFKAPALITAANVLIVLHLVREREAILREVMAYQHRWVITEGRRITAHRTRQANPFLPSASSAQNDPMPSSSSYTRRVEASMKAVNACLRRQIKTSTALSSSPSPLHQSLSDFYKTLFDVPAAAFASSSSSTEALYDYGTPTPHMLSSLVDAPPPPPSAAQESPLPAAAADASEYLRRKLDTYLHRLHDANADDTHPSFLAGVAVKPIASSSPAAGAAAPSPFTSAAMYAQSLLVSKGDLKAALGALTDSYYNGGFGHVVGAMQRDALAIRSLRAGGGEDGDESSLNRCFTVPVPVSPITAAEANCAGGGNKEVALQLHRLLEGRASLALPEKLRATTVGIGLRLARTLLSFQNGLVSVNALAAALSEARVRLGEDGRRDWCVGDDDKDLQRLLNNALVSLRSGVISRTLATETVYFGYAIGNEKWVMGIVGDSLHMRRSLEKIQNVHVAHVMNNHNVATAMIAFKQLISCISVNCVLEARLK